MHRAAPSGLRDANRPVQTLSSSVRVNGTKIVRAGSGVKNKRPKGAPKLQMVAVPLLDMQAGTIGQAGGQFAVVGCGVSAGRFDAAKHVDLSLRAGIGLENLADARG